MENAMRINLKPDQDAPAPEFRKQGHHMLEIIAAQIKEMEDAGYPGREIVRKAFDVFFDDCLTCFDVLCAVTTRHKMIQS